MNWRKCEEEFIKRVEIDPDKIESIIKMCNARKRIIDCAEIDDETASIIASDYYEIMKELLIALLLKQGLKSNNHECLISFFRNKYPQYEYETNSIHQLKDVRNRANYDGVFVKKEYVINNKLEFRHIIELLERLVKC